MICIKAKKVITKVKSLDTKNILPYCEKNLEFINDGTGRKVFVLSDDLVLKVAYNNAGIEQNRVECSIHDSDVCATIYQYHEDYAWVVMERLEIYEPNELEVISGSTVADRTIWLEYNSIWDSTPDKFVEARTTRYDKKIKEDGWVDKMKKSSLINKTTSLINDNMLEAGDLVRNSSWGFSKGNKDKPLLFDYGLSNKVWTECYKILEGEFMFGESKGSANVVEVVGHTSKTGDMVRIWVNGIPNYYEKL